MISDAEPPRPPTTDHERRLRRWVMIWALISVPPMFHYGIEAFTGPDASRAYAVNSVAKEVSWLILAVLVWSNVRRFARLLTVVICGHVAIIASLVALIATGHAGSSFPDLPEWLLPEDLRLAGWLCASTLAAAALLFQQIRARRSVLGLEYFLPIQYETLVALSDTVIDGPKVPARDVARSVDRYWAGFPMQHRSRARLALMALYYWPVFTFKAPFPLMDAAHRKRFIERRFLHGVAHRHVLAPLRPIVRTTIRFTIQMVYMGYYSDPRSHDETGYVPFSKRRPDARRKCRPGLQTLEPGAPRPLGLEAEVVIVGTGAAGGVIAHTLVAAGHDVLMLERGAHVAPEAFTEHELSQYAQLYRDGALQLSQDFRFQALQGMCVGGSTTVNNGVCFRLPSETLTAWNGAYGAQLSPERLSASFAAVEDLVAVTEVPAAAIGAGALAVAAADDRFEPLHVNLEDCVGCGSCNIGCPYGRKLSMLDHVLPQAQRNGNGSLRILPLCEVVRIDEPAAIGDRRVMSLRAKVGAERRPVHVRAQTIVLAAGAIHSSRLLQNSGLGGPLVGRGLCANLGSFMTGEFLDRPPEGLAGIQQTHSLSQPGTGYLLETWFNPVVSQSLVMPGWLEQHRQNMRRYGHMTCVGALVGTAPQPRNRVRKPGLLGGEFSLTPSEAELRRVVEALKEAGRILRAAGAFRVMPATFTYREYRSDEELADLDSLLLDPDDLSLQTAHPQGGNPISADPHRGVVDPTFRVHGYDNLYCCDASVFPTGITFPPQLTVMALAHLAATDPNGLGGLGLTSR